MRWVSHIHWKSHTLNLCWSLNIWSWQKHTKPILYRLLEFVNFLQTEGNRMRLMNVFLCLFVSSEKEKKILKNNSLVISNARVWVNKTAQIVHTNIYLCNVMVHMWLTKSICVIKRLFAKLYLFKLRTLLSHLFVAFDLILLHFPYDFRTCTVDVWLWLTNK